MVAFNKNTGRGTLMPLLYGVHILTDIRLLLNELSHRNVHTPACYSSYKALVTVIEKWCPRAGIDLRWYVIKQAIYHLTIIRQIQIIYVERGNSRVGLMGGHSAVDSVVLFLYLSLVPILLLVKMCRTSR